MNEDWQSKVVVALREIGITQKQFARECGYTEAYMSQILRCRKETVQAKERIEAAISRLKGQKNSELYGVR